MNDNDPLGLLGGADHDPLGLFEEAPTKKNSKKFYQELAENVGGLGAAIGDLAEGAVKLPLQIGTTAVGKILTPDVSTEAHRMAAQDTVEQAFPSIGHSFGVDQNPTYQAAMKPFELLGEGVNWVGDRFSNKDVSGAIKNTADAALLGIGIPGAKTAGRALGKVAEVVDPGLRNIGKAGETLRDVKETHATTRTSAVDPLGILDIDLSQGPGMPDVMQMTREGQGILRPEDAAYRDEAILRQRAEQAKGSNELYQTELFDQPESGRPPMANEAVLGDWRIDENGMPIKADLSMEARNLEEPLQRNLWGDELEQKHPQEAARGITEALDSMPDLPWRTERDTAIDLLRGEIEAPGQLKAAKAAADSGRPFPGGAPDGAPTGKFVVPKSQRGAINPEVFKEGFEKLKDLGNGMWLRAIPDPHSKGSLFIEARKDGHRIGTVTFDPKYAAEKGADGKYPQNLEAFSVRVDPDFRQHGVATEMYNFARELGNDIQPSLGNQTEFGKAMWDGFERKGVSENGMIRSPGNRQQGAIWLGEKKRQQLEKVLGKENMVADDPNVKEAIAASYGQKDSKASILLESGSTMHAMKTGSNAVLAASRLLQNALKRADLKIREMVLPVESAFRKLYKGELEAVAMILKHEMLSGERFSPEAIERMTVKQQKAYGLMRAMFDDTLKVQNEARAAKGQKPITEVEAYLSSRWDGAYRRPVFEAVLDRNGNPKFDEKGNPAKKLVWYLAADSKWGLEKQAAALRKERPDLEIDAKNDHIVRHYKKQTDLQSAMTTMIDVLGRDDPAVQAMAEIVKQQTVNEAATFLGQEKHFKEKAGIRGFVGDRPGKVGTFPEALAMIQQQVQYAKNAYKWSEIQKVGSGIKEIIADPRLKEEQPNNIKYIREHFKNALGHGEAAAVAHMADALRELGWNIDSGAKLLGDAKTYFILSKLAVSTGNALVNMIQFANILPHMMSAEFAGARKHIPVALAVGVPGGILMGLGHYGKALGYLTEGLPHDQAGFYHRAFKYAEDNGITARSIYDESPVESSFSVIGRTANVAGKTISIPETFTRSMAYTIAVQFLKDTGQFKKDIDLFQRAEEMVNAAMVDYRSTERPMAFTKLGAVGNFLNTLQTYPINWYNQWSYFARESMKGNIAPFMAAFALQYALAGAMGVPYFNDMDKLYQFTKDHLPAKYYNQVRKSEFWDDPKMWMVRNFGAASVYGVLSDKTGLGLTSRLATPGMEDMIQSPIGPSADIGKQIINTGKAVLNPNRDTIAQAAMTDSPVGLQGLVEHAPAFEGSTFEKRPDGKTTAMRPADIESHTAVYHRTPEEVDIRKFGLRSTQEMISREVNWRQKRNDMVAAEKTNSLPDAIYSAAKRGDVDEVRELTRAYVALSGKEMSDEKWEALVSRNYLTADERKLLKKNITPLELLNLTRARAVLDQVRKEQQQK